MRLSLYSGNLSTYYKIITLMEGKNPCTSLYNECILTIRNYIFPILGPRDIGARDQKIFPHPFAGIPTLDR